MNSSINLYVESGQKVLLLVVLFLLLFFFSCSIMKYKQLVNPCSGKFQISWRNHVQDDTCCNFGESLLVARNWL